MNDSARRAGEAKRPLYFFDPQSKSCKPCADSFKASAGNNPEYKCAKFEESSKTGLNKNMLSECSDLGGVNFSSASWQQKNLAGSNFRSATFGEINVSATRFD